MSRTHKLAPAESMGGSVVVALIAWLLAFTLHNAEELWLGFPTWLGAHVALAPTANAALFTGIVIALTAVAAIAVWAYAKTRAKWAKTVLLVYIAGTLINVVSHAAMAVWAHTYAPGLVTSLLLVLPADLWLLYEFKRTK